MSEPTDREAQDKANLTRIRDNQRRSRARRKEYLQDLEQRLRIYELQGVEASAEIQQAARRVLDENKKLRVLLNEQGVTDSQIESFLQASNTAVSYTPQGPTAAEESVIQALSRLLAPRHPSFDSVGTPLISPGYDDDSRHSSILFHTTNADPSNSRPLLIPTGELRHSAPSRTYGSNRLDEDAQTYHSALSSRNSLDLDGMTLNTPVQRPSLHLARQSISDPTGMWSDTPSQISPVSTLPLQTSLISHSHTYLDNVQYAQHQAPAFSSHWHSGLGSGSTSGSRGMLNHDVLPTVSHESSQIDNFDESMEESEYHGRGF
ncbi:hypothetical protein BKA67DRAFT_652885 [Truncatella angustata]|uniref:BZIP domain-containing protein n=1 Tax=Truncatella angustata TaxID=152316 RepID=A0A9P8UWT1_9PEZI|nr:uncharacterized protein BKA67DRAFT_652885 [Truncatella angustata]KAH6659662.1 hypothetical protein BKA67DRAFT_652885 [Truncatella angustata]